MPACKRASKTGHGGARAGAGRKPREQPSIVVPVRFEPDQLEALDEWAEKRDLKRSPAVAECVRRELKRSGGR